MYLRTHSTMEQSYTYSILIFGTILPRQHHDLYNTNCPDNILFYRKFFYTKSRRMHTTQLPKNINVHMCICYMEQTLHVYTILQNPGLYIHICMPLHTHVRRHLTTKQMHPQLLTSKAQLPHTYMYILIHIQDAHVRTESSVPVTPKAPLCHTYIHTCIHTYIHILMHTHTGHTHTDKELHSSRQKRAHGQPLRSRSVIVVISIQLTRTVLGC
jgi:hypothetical protein